MSNLSDLTEFRDEPLADRITILQDLYLDSLNRLVREDPAYPAAARTAKAAMRYLNVTDADLNGAEKPDVSETVMRARAALEAKRAKKGSK
jgi:hypothetical protein